LCYLAENLIKANELLKSKDLLCITWDFRGKEDKIFSIVEVVAEYLAVW